MAPASTQPVLREALALGADRAVLLSDQWFAGSDTLATSRILAAAIGRLAPFDLICCGNFTLDGSTAQVPSQIAELLGIPNIMHVSRLELKGARQMVVTQKIEHGYVKLAAAAPLLLSFTKEANKPRYSSFLEILAAEDPGDRHLEQCRPATGRRVDRFGGLPHPNGRSAGAPPRPARACA